jgi:endonuclease/exonuclease/phosphatase family metal-dependent hydrolase
MPRVVVASFNVHGGVDGWGRPFDVVDACRRIGADVLMLQECWFPDDGVSMADRVATALGYTSVELAFARGRITGPPARPHKRWGPRLLTGSVHGLSLDRPRRRMAERTRSAARTPKSERGSWSIAVLSRLPVLGSHTIDLGKLPTDHARRGAIVMDIDVAGAASGAPLRVVGTHLAHLSQGSPRHIAALRRTLNAMTPVPCVLAGDMNLWGPPLVTLLPGWSRAVRGRTWPTWLWRPIAQPDHILVRGIKAEGGEVLPVTESDHLPVRATLVID